jgi:hypothetical protein
MARPMSDPTDYRNAMPDPNRNEPWRDLLNMLLAIWLFLSPWVLEFGSHLPTEQLGSGAAAAQTASMNAWWLGAIVFLISASAIFGRTQLWQQPWQEWLNLILGAWIFIAPWVLGFFNLHVPSFNHWIVGAMIFAIAASSLSRMQQESPRLNEPQRFPH